MWQGLLEYFESCRYKMRGARPNTGKSNNITGNAETGAGTEKDNEQMGDPRQDKKIAKDPVQKTRAKQDDKRVAELVARVRIGAWRLLSCAFLLAIRLFYFLTFSSSESVIG